MKNTVIYHSADYDGIFCREIARKFLPDAEFIGWNFGDPLVEVKEGLIYILDLSPDCIATVPTNGIIWIDHHKTSIEKYGNDIRGYRIDGVAACRLAWQWFIGAVEMPTKQDFIDRKVSEPLAVRLAGEYDIWDKRDPDAEVLQYALRTFDPDWKRLLDYKDPIVYELLATGRVVQTYAQNVDASICKSLTWLLQWEGLTFLCVNHARFNSLLFTARDIPETGHDALLGFRFDGKSWMVSLYHAKHRKDIDLSEIAKKYNGGGHRGACGFVCKTLPFTL